MSSGQASSAGPKDPTFRSYTADQAAAYARSRKGYSSTLYEYLIRHHVSTGGKVEVLLDVGCGPGNATKELAQAFDHAIGCDPGLSMITQAKTEKYKTRTGDDVVFEVCPAEDLGSLKALGPGSVDMITCAMSAHWFQLEKFYPCAARLLKPGGTLAMWTCGSFFVHPEMPNAKLVQQHLNELEYGTLGPYTVRGNQLSQNIYDDIDLPWTFEPPICQAEFAESGLHRKAWNRDGQVDEGEAGGFLSGGQAMSLPDSAKALGTASMVTRWREAHRAQLDRGEIEDCVQETFSKIRRTMEIDEGEENQFQFRTGMATGLVMLKRI